MKSIKIIVLNFILIYISLLLNNNLYSQKPEAIKQFNAGVESEQSENYDEAAAYFSLAINLEPNFYDAFSHLGIVHLKLNNYVWAIKDYTKLLMLSNTSENYLNRAKVYLEMKEYESVLNDLSKAIQLDTNSYEAYYIRASIYYRKLEYDSALADFQKCDILYPGYEDAQEKLAFLQRDKDDKLDSLNNTPEQLQNVDGKEFERFKDNNVHIEPQKQNVINNLITENFEEDIPVIGINEVTNQTISQIDIPEQTQTSKNIVLINKNNNKVIKEPQKQNEVNNLIAENIKKDIPVIGIKEVTNQTFSQIDIPEQPQTSENTVLKKSNDNEVVKEKQNESNNLLELKNTVNNISAAPKNNDIDVPISSTEKTKQQSADKNQIEKLTDAVIPDTLQKQKNNSVEDNIKEVNNTAGQQNNKIVILNSSAEMTEQHLADKSETKKLTDAVIPIASQKLNDDAIAENIKKNISNSEGAEEAYDIPNADYKSYAIQLGAFDLESNAIELTKKAKNILDYEVNTYLNFGLFKVRIGNYQLEEALSVVKKIRESGFAEAFIIDSTK